MHTPTRPVALPLEDKGDSGADPGFLKGGVHLRSTRKKGGGGPRGGPTLGLMLKSLHRGPKGGGGAGPPGPPPPPDPPLRFKFILRSAYHPEVCIRDQDETKPHCAFTVWISGISWAESGEGGGAEHRQKELTRRRACTYGEHTASSTRSLSKILAYTPPPSKFWDRPWIFPWGI